MIDYDKLKEAHELAASSEGYHFNVMMGLENLVKFNLFRTNEGVVLETLDIDELITKLRELTKPEPKYEDGQEVWVMYLPPYTDSTQPGKFKTDAHKYEDGIHQYCLIGNGVGLTWRKENDIYPTREALIEAQIEYWLSLSDKSPTQILTSAIVDKAQKRYEELTEKISSKKLSSEDRKILNNVPYVSACKHESDGYAYALGKCTGIKLPSLPRTPYNFKCKHCGEFYR